MHLEGPWLSTTSTRKRAEKLTKREKEDLERGWRERNVFLKGINLPKESFEQYLDWVYGRGKKNKTKTKYAPKFAQAVPKTPVKNKDGVENVGNIQTAKISDQDIGQASGDTDIATVQVSRLSSWITGPVTSKPSPTYTGTKILGIGTMHKSNAVPIFSDDEAKEISSMRR